MVDPPVQRRGLGRALTTALLERMVELGLLEAQLTVDPLNARALALYRDLGFIRVVAEEAYFGPGKPRVLLRRPLG